MDTYEKELSKAVEKILSLPDEDLDRLLSDSDYNFLNQTDPSGKPLN